MIWPAIIKDIHVTVVPDLVGIIMMISYLQVEYVLSSTSLRVSRNKKINILLQ